MNNKPNLYNYLIYAYNNGHFDSKEDFVNYATNCYLHDFITIKQLDALLKL